MPTSNANKNNWQQWMLNALFTVSLGIGGYMYTTQQAAYERAIIEASQERQARQTEESRQNERLAVLETKLENQTEKIDKMLSRQEEILNRLPRK